MCVIRSRTHQGWLRTRYDCSALFANGRRKRSQSGPQKHSFCVFFCVNTQRTQRTLLYGFTSNTPRHKAQKETYLDTNTLHRYKSLFIFFLRIYAKKKMKTHNVKLIYALPLSFPLLTATHCRHGTHQHGTLRTTRRNERPKHGRSESIHVLFEFF